MLSTRVAELEAFKGPAEEALKALEEAEAALEVAAASAARAFDQAEVSSDAIYIFIYIHVI